MATRRPKVPKVSPARHAGENPDGGSPEGAHVIQADFGPGKDKDGRDERAGTGGEPTPKGGEGNRKIGASRQAFAGRRKGSSATDAGPATDEEQHPVPAKAFSGRMLALAVVMIAITIMLAPTVKIFFDKKAEIDALNADIAAREAEGDMLRQQVSRWRDPNYVKQQARDRINMVMPGETGYWVFGSDLPAGESSSQTAAAAQDPADLPWVDSLWESITRAATD